VVALEIDHCSFPDDLFYDVENNTWLRFESQNTARIGITSILSGLAGKFTSVRLKQTGLELQRGRSLGTLESLRFVGPIPSPFSGTILETNEMVEERPKLLNDSPYFEGWIATVKPTRLSLERGFLSTATAASGKLQEKIRQLRVRCFKAYPDHEMVEIGVECAAVLVRLNELIATIPRSSVVHIVSDDPTAYVEMERWVDQTKNQLVDWRTEGNLFHFIVRKSVP
jgi:glycine cleavage system H lipoate-binding protein/TusA-related sulfurtransferase